MARPTRIATTLVGTGRLARSLAPLLGRAGYPVVAVVGRRLAGARAVRTGRSRALATSSLGRGVERGRMILLAVSDRSIAPLARELAALRGIDWKSRVVLHHAGALGPEPLAPLARAGASVAVLHPLQSLGMTELAAEVLPGSRARIEGDRRGAAEARKLARALGMKPLPLGKMDPDDRTSYHAAASIVSNDILALLAVAASLMESAGLDGQRALDALLPLARGTLRQVAHGGLGGALTGPAVRGDLRTLRSHLKRLSAAAPGEREIHRLLSVRLARLALELGEDGAAATLQGLGGPGRKRGV